MDNRHQRKRELTDRLERYRRLAREFTDMRTINQLRELENDILTQLRDLDADRRG
jgi:hypothetical protein